MPYPRAMSSREKLSSSSNDKNKPFSQRKFDSNPHAGLINLGNTCFLNSVIQASASTKPLRELFLPETVDHHLDGVQASQDYSNGANTSSSPSSTSNPDPYLLQRSKSPALLLADQEHGHQIQDSLLSPSPSQSPSLGSQPPSYHPTTSDLPLNTSFRHTLEKMWDASYSTFNPNPSQSVARPLRMDKATAVNPRTLLKQLSKKHSHYGDYGQQDAHEAMRQLWDGMRMEECDMIKKLQPPIPKASIPRRHSVDATPSSSTLLTITSTPRRPESTAPGSSRPKGTDIATSDGPQIEEKMVPWVDMLFCGKLESVVICESCRHISHVYEDFFDVSLSVRPDESRIRKRDRLFGFADRWRRASKDSRAPVASSAVSTPARSLTPSAKPSIVNKNEDSESGTASDGNWLRRDSSPGPTHSDAERGRFQLRKSSAGKKKGRASKRGRALTESDAEPDFPDMASMTLAPVSTSADTPLKSNAEIKPNGRAQFADGTDSKTPLLQSNGKKNSNPRQAAYIAKLFADQPASSSSGGLQKGQWSRNLQSPPGLLSFPDVIAAATESAHGAFGGELREQEKSQHQHRERERSRSRARRTHEEPVIFGGPTPSAILDQQNSTGLVSALRQFTSVELLDGENAFACKRCWRLANPRGETEAELARKKARSRRLKKAREEGISLEDMADAAEAEESEESDDDEDEDDGFEEAGKGPGAASDSSPLSFQASDRSSGSIPSLVSPNGSIAAPSTSSVSTSDSTSSAPAPAPNHNLADPSRDLQGPSSSSKLEISADETITPKTGAAVFSAAQNMLEQTKGNASPLSPPATSNSSSATTSQDARRPSLKEVLEPPTESDESSSQVIEERKTSIPVIQMEEPRSPPSGDHLLDPQFSFARSTEEDSTPISQDSTPAAPIASNSRLAAPVARKGALQLGNASGSDTENSICEGSGNTGTSVYDTGDETDQSGVGTSNQMQSFSAPKAVRSGPRRSSQSLPRRALKRYLISSAPPVLIFHFKRFQATSKGFASLGGGGNFKKIDDSVSYPEFLDISPWMAPPREDYDRNGALKDTSDPIALEKYNREKAREDALKGGNGKSLAPAKEAMGRKPSLWHWRGKSPDPSLSAQREEDGQVAESHSRTRYRLYAVVVHQGSMSSGHYTSYVLSDRVRFNSDDPKTSAPSSRVNTPAPSSRGPTPAPPSRTSTPAPPTSLHQSRPSTPAQLHRLSNPSSINDQITSPAKEAPLSPKSSLKNSISSTSPSIPRASSQEDSKPGAEAVNDSLAVLSSSDSQGASVQMSKAPSTNGSVSSAMSSTGQSGTDKEGTLGSGAGENGLDKSSTTVMNSTSATNSVSASSLPLSNQGSRPSRSQSNRLEYEDKRRWVFCSDTTVRGATIEEVLGQKAYLLYYEQI